MKDFAYYETPKTPPPGRVQTQEEQKQLLSHLAELEELRAEFKSDLFAEFLVANNPKAEMAYEIALELCIDDADFSYIYDAFEQIVRLIKD